VLGHDVPVKAVVAEVEGYRKRFTLVSSATELTGLQIVELFCARFRQEDGFRDLKRRLGWEECRAWTRLPVGRTTLMLVVVRAAMRRLEWALDQRRGDDWWLHPPWNQHNDHPSVRDVERLLRRHRGEIQRHLSDWLDGCEEPERVPARRVAMRRADQPLLGRREPEAAGLDPAVRSRYVSLYNILHMSIRYPKNWGRD